MTYCLGWKTDNYAYLVADAAVLSSRPLVEEHSSFGELHVQFEDKNIQEGALKIFPIGDAALTFAGDARNGYSILHNLRTALDADQPYRRAFQSAIDSNTPFSEESPLLYCSLISKAENQSLHPLMFKMTSGL